MLPLVHPSRITKSVVDNIDVTCIEKANKNANTGFSDEGIVFSMKNCANNFVFGQVPLTIHNPFLK